MYTNTAYWTTAREFTLDAVLAVGNSYKFEQWHIPQYTYKHDVSTAKRCRPRCADLEIVVKIPNVTHGGIN